MIFRTLTATAKEPVRSTEHSAGLDLFSDQRASIAPGQTVIISTGITFDLEKQDDYPWFLGLYLRSSLSISGLILGNGVGVIDSDYAGKEIKVIITNVSNDAKLLAPGSKIAQIVVQKHYSQRAGGVTFKYDKRVGGLGSTGS